MEETNPKRKPKNPSDEILQPQQNKHLDAVEDNDKGNVHSQGRGDWSPSDNDLDQIETPLKSRKRLVGSASEINPPNAKRARSPVQDVHPQQPLEIGQQKTAPSPLRPSHSSNPYAFVFDWLESIGTDRDIRCQPNTNHNLLDDNPVSRKAARSLPDMTGHHATDGLVTPTPPSIRLESSIGPSPLSIDSAKSPGQSSGNGLVSKESYRNINLQTNGIYMRPPWSYPEHIASLVDRVAQGRRSPGPPLEELRQNTELQCLEDGAGEAEVETYFHFKTDIFPEPIAVDTLRCSIRLPLAKHIMPEMKSSAKVSNPTPDLLYGYSHQAFDDDHVLFMGHQQMTVNTQRIYFPFLAVEFKGDSPGSPGSLWAATNQCLGDSTACVNATERLNDHIRQSSTIQPINSSAFSIAMNGSIASLYVSWKHDEHRFYTARVGSFALQDPEHYVKFRTYVRNIIDWGQDERFKEIQKSLGVLLT